MSPLLSPFAPWRVATKYAPAASSLSSGRLDSQHTDDLRPDAKDRHHARGVACVAKALVRPTGPRLTGHTHCGHDAATPLMSRRLLPLFVFALALAGGWRSLSIGHLSDDWALLDYAARHGNSAQWTGPWLELESLRFHRPLFTGLYALDYVLSGSDPFLPHVLQVAVHGLSALLLFAFLRLLGVRPAGAAAGGVLFALHPFLPGATGWLAGRCGTFAGFFTLLTGVLWLMPANGMRNVLSRSGAVLAAVAAALTRESGYLALILPFTLDLCSAARPSIARLVTRHAFAAAAGAALLMLRYASLGTVGGGYPETAGLVGGGERAVAALKQAGLALLDLMGTLPALADPERVLAIATGASLLLILVFGWRLASAAERRAAFALLLLFATQFLLLVLLDPTLHPSTGQRWYSAIACFAGIVGTLSAGLFIRARAFAPLWLLPVVVLGHWRVQDEMLQSNSETQALLRSAEIMVRAEKKKRVEDWKIDLGPVLFSCLPESRAGFPTFQWGVSSALAPPFISSPLPARIYPVHRFMYLGPQTNWKVHPPVEALLHIRGRQPYSIGPTNPLAPDFGELRSADVHSIITFLGDKPWDWKDYFGGELPVLLPQHAASELIPCDLSEDRLAVRVDARGCREIEFFCFLEGVDMRHRMPVPAPAPDGSALAEMDLSSELAPYARFFGRPTEIHIVAVGWRADDPARPKLSRVITFMARP